MLADAYATAFMSMGLNKTKKFLVQNPNIQVCLVYTNKYGEWETYVSKDLEKTTKSYFRMFLLLVFRIHGSSLFFIKGFWLAHVPANSPFFINILILFLKS